MLRELLTDHPESVRWPESLGRALGTRGFAREVNAVLSRAREKGHDGADLRRWASSTTLPELVAAGLFLEQYLDNLDSVGATDYADLIRRATIEAAEHRDELRARFRHVFVDEYQDTDPGQVALLRQLAGDGRDLVVVGDPHQSIYGFRGAEVRGILDFPSAFPRSDGRPADVVALAHHPPLRHPAARGLAAGRRPARAAGLDPRRGQGGVPPPGHRGRRRGAGRRPHLRHRAGRGRAPRRPAAPRPPRGRRRLGRHGGAGAVRAHVDPAAAARAGRGRRAGRGHLRRGAAGARPRRAPAARRAARRRQPRQRRRRPRRLRALLARRVAAAEPARRARRRRPAAAGPGAAAARQGRGPATPTSHRRRRPTWCARPSSTPGSSTAWPAARRCRGPRRSPSCWPAAAPPSTAAPRPRRCCGCSGRAPAGPSGCAAPPRPAVRPPGTPTATSTRSAPSSRWWPGPSSSGCTSASPTCSPPSPRSRSPPTPSPSAARAGPRCGCSPRTAPRAWSGGSSSSPTCSRRPGPTCGAAPRCSSPTGSAPTAWCRRSPRASCSWRSGGCSTSRAPAPRSGSSSPPSARPTTTASSRRGSSTSSSSRSSTSSGARPARCPRPASSPSCAARVADPATPEPLRRAAARRLARLAGSHRGPAPAGAAGRPVHLVGHPRRHVLHRAAARGRPAGAAVGQPARRDRRVPGALVPRARGGRGRRGRTSRSTSARCCTRSPTGSPAARSSPSVDALMAHVDEVWERLEFRTPWSKAREHERVRAALARFLRWHADNPRELLATEQPFAAVVDVPDPPRRRGRRPAHRLRRPARARRRRPGRGRRPQDRAQQAHRQVRHPARAAGALPARRRLRRRRRPRRRPRAGRRRRCRAGAARHPRRLRRRRRAAPGRAAARRPRAGGAARADRPRRRAAARGVVPGAWPASTAATARSSRSARPRARGR